MACVYAYGFNANGSEVNMAAPQLAVTPSCTPYTSLPVRLPPPTTHADLASPYTSTTTGSGRLKAGSVGIATGRDNQPLGAPINN